MKKSLVFENRKTHKRYRLRTKACMMLLMVLFLLFIGLVVVFCERELPYYIYPNDYFDVIEEIAADKDIDAFLVCAVIKAESNFNPQAVSGAGAVGLMQIMPQTGEWLAKLGGLEYNEDMLTEPECNIKLGCIYLRFLLDYWQNDVYKAIASYNAGQANVARWLADGIWDGSSDNLADIPFDETKKYVDRVMEIYLEYQELY